MKPFLRLSLALVIVATTQMTYAQLTKLSNNTSLNGALLNNKPIFISDVDNTFWTTDGTATGTIQFTHKVKIDTTNYGSETILSNKLYFKGVDTANNKGLWITDGTDAGTMLVMNTGTAPDSSILSTFVVYNNIVFFFAYTPNTGIKLWKTNGTSAGTVLIKDIKPFTKMSIDPREGVGYFISNGMLFFVADDAMHGNEWWKTDGTTGGTALVKDINPGPGDGFTSFPQFNAQKLGSITFFIADDGTGVEVWKTDGTPGGTAKVKDINPDPNGSNPFGFVVFNNKIYFSAFDTSQNQKLWVTDGTDTGTTILKDILNTDLQSSIIFGNHLVFTGYNSTTGYGLWATDGTTGGTVLLKDTHGFPYMLFDYNSTNDSNHISHAPPFNGKVFLEVRNSQGALDLWITDGTKNGTFRLDTIYSTSNSIIIDYFYTQKNIYLIGPSNGNNDYELWKSNGTIGGTQLVEDINGGSGSSYPGFEFVYNDHLYLIADDGDNNQGLLDLFKVDEQVTLPLTLLDFSAAAQPSKAVKLEWNTTNQTNVSYFEIERSIDGIRFSSIYKKSDIVNSRSQQHYQYLDLQATVLNMPDLFYRLKMTDRDGSYRYSKILPVHFYNNSLRLSLSPNPVRNQLNVVIETKETGDVSLRVTDAAGKQIYMQKLPSSGGTIQHNISVARWQGGVYYLQLITGKEVKTAPFIKQ